MDIWCFCYCFNECTVTHHCIGVETFFILILLLSC
jgi:hypothetical protein